jgi:S-adenosylmethionine synthetase
MFEKVNPTHPDKVADRIAGALVDIAYANQENPKVAAEVLIGHGLCTIIVESSYEFTKENVLPVVQRIAGKNTKLKLISVPQDPHLADNQDGEIRCGDNGIFKGVPMTSEEMELSSIAREIYSMYPTDGKYVIDEKQRTLIVCQSCCDSKELGEWLHFKYPDYEITVNPLGDWTGGPNVDSGATNRKLGSDMGSSVTGGGLCGKDISKSDVSVNIYAFLEAQRTGKSQEFFCAIGDTEINGVPYSEIVKTAKEYIDKIGGFEAFAEYGLI